MIKIVLVTLLMLAVIWVIDLLVLKIIKYCYSRSVHRRKADSKKLRRAHKIFLNAIDKYNKIITQKYAKIEDQQQLLLYLIDGSLLGAVRNDQFICNDHDIDIGCLGVDIGLLKYLLEKETSEPLTVIGKEHEYKILLGIYNLDIDIAYFVSDKKIIMKREDNPIVAFYLNRYSENVVNFKFDFDKLFPLQKKKVSFFDEDNKLVDYENMYVFSQPHAYLNMSYKMNFIQNQLMNQNCEQTEIQEYYEL